MRLDLWSALRRPLAAGLCLGVAGCAGVGTAPAPGAANRSVSAPDFAPEMANQPPVGAPSDLPTVIPTSAESPLVPPAPRPRPTAGDDARDIEGPPPAPAGDPLGPLDPLLSDGETIAGAESDGARTEVSPLPLVPIDFTAALTLAAGENPQIAFANEQIREAFAQLEQAEALWLPSINAGVNYANREGRLQDVEGDVFDISRASLFTGFGARAVGAAHPPIPGLVMQFHLRDAIFQPRIAQRATAARQQAARTMTNDTLLEVALAYIGLLGAFQQQAIAEDTLRNADDLAELTRHFAETGQAPQADADRAQTELAIRRNDLARAREAVRVASSRLVRLLSGDPQVQLAPQEPTVAPVDLVPPETPLPELVGTALVQRPELAEAQLLVSEAVQRLNREKYAPLVPSVLLGASYGGFGGSPGSAIDNWGDRFDFDVAAHWEIRNFGVGERAARDETRSRVRQAQFRQVQLMDQVAQDVVEAHAQVQARRGQIATAEHGVAAAIDSHRRNIERIRGGEGLPLEVLQSLQALDQARREYLRAVIDYNEAQFRLHRALGWPGR